ncbi:ComEC/Rec2 family competence protein [Leucobacter rhizosphaerae]|uniref:ComEC/Rec2 family competence protein n=1 Tax=Leucobacter rhizosphaerae TaxID=2932245 RepID=A0ABY4FWV7_9MICO|nr:ComEC/Rec2 family competence protein [Leucobacter rhizosphaerae]UOQ60777.1 ComEC/Rec2 family competence protein [Leucobacter rhizosphaerae]
MTAQSAAGNGGGFGFGPWIAGIAAALGCVLWRWFPGAWRVTVLGCAVLVLLGARIGVAEWQRADPGLARAAATRAMVDLQATVRGYPEDVETGADRASGSWVRADVDTPRGLVPVLLWLRGSAAGASSSASGDDALAPGVQLRVSGRIEALGPGSSAVYGVAVAEGTEAAGTGGSRVAVALRHGLHDAAAEVTGAELVPGFAVGDTSLVSEALNERMRQSSLTHLVAVSGANCALVTSALIAVSAGLGAGRRVRLLVAAVALGGFVVVVGPDPSVQRAAIMAVVVLVSGYGGKRAVALPALGLAMITLLIADPWQAVQPGFAMSVAATAGILVLVPSLVRAGRRLTRLPVWLVTPVAVAFAAQLACGPLLLLLDPGLPAVGVLANVLAGPAAPLGTGLGLLALSALPFSSALGTGFVQLAALPARWVAATAEVCAGLPLARWEWPGGWSGAILLATAQALFLLGWLVRSGRVALPDGTRAALRGPWHERSSSPRSIRTVAAVLLCGGAAIVVSMSAVGPMTSRATTARDWAIVACDVGQGDAIMLRDPAHPQQVVLVDTGDDQERLRACVQRFGVQRIALLVLTHDDRDHVGALDAVGGIVQRAIIAPATREDESRGTERPVVASLDRRGIPHRIAAAGARSTSGDAVGWRVLAPPVGIAPAESNDASLIIRVQVGGLSVLLLGDSGRDEHAALLAREPSLTADVVKIAHHGSRDADMRVVTQTGADVALISVGADNGYGHPAPETLRALDVAGTEALRTDERGSIAISGSPGDLQVWSERSPPDVRGGE